jgi:hypothetical protein
VLSLVLVFGPVFSSSSSFPLPNIAFAADMDDMGGDSSGGDSSGGDSSQGGDSGDGEDSNDNDSSDGMPKDAPQTTGALTAGGDSDNDDDDNESGGRDNDEENNNDNEPTSEDSPVTTDALTAQKKDCPKGQEVTLFSTSCKIVGESDSAEGAISTSMGCPIIPEKMRAGNLLSDPGLRAHCTGEQVIVPNRDGTDATYDPDGTKSILTYVGSGDAKSLSQADKYDADNRLTSRSKFDPSTDTKVQTIEYEPGTTRATSLTTYNPINGKPVEKIEAHPGTSVLARQTSYDPNTGKPRIVMDFFNGYNIPYLKKSTIYTPDGGRIERDLIENLETTYDKEGKVTNSQIWQKDLKNMDEKQRRLSAASQ